MSPHAALILSPDVLAAALVGAAVELAGFRAHFAHVGETGREALRRTRATVVLLDCDHAESCDEAIIGPALMTGARLLLYRSRRGTRDPRTLAAARDLPLLTLPDDTGRLVELLSGRG